MEKIEVQMFLYKLTKNFMNVQRNILNIFGIILFYKVLGWFDGQNIGVEPRRPRFNPFKRHILCGVCIFMYYTLYMCVNV
jgi:hypothetical protein